MSPADWVPWITACAAAVSATTAVLKYRHDTRSTRENAAKPSFGTWFLSFLNRGFFGLFVLVAVLGSGYLYFFADFEQPDERRVLASGAVRLTGEIVANPCNGSDVCPSASLVIENNSGIGFDAVLKDINNGVSIGLCLYYSGTVQSSGLTMTNLRYLQPQAQPPWRFLPKGSRTDVKITSSNACQNDRQLLTAKTADLTITLLVKVGEKTFDLPLSATKLPVRSIKQIQ